MWTRVLKCEDEIEVFVSEYNRLAGGVRYSSGQLKGLKVRAFYDSMGRIMGGYAVNSTPPYRTLSYVPGDVTIRGVKIQHTTEVTCAEVVALWINSSATNLLRALLYSRSVIDCYLMSPNYILGGCSLSGARRTQMRVLPNLLWEGNGVPFNKVVYNWVYYSGPLEAVARLPYAIAMGWLDRSRLIRRVTKRFNLRNKGVRG